MLGTRLGSDYSIGSIQIFQHLGDINGLLYYVRFIIASGGKKKWLLSTSRKPPSLSASQPSR